MSAIMRGRSWPPLGAGCCLHGMSAEQGHFLNAMSSHFLHVYFVSGLSLFQGRSNWIHRD